ncbi:MAG: Fic family protein [Candidatus Coatesbacteria bacterium]
MKDRGDVWKPAYTISPSIARTLMDIEAVRAVVENTPLSPAVEAELRHKARLRSTHFSTQIEGNKLSLREAREVVERRKRTFHGRERDVSEVSNYWDALLRVENWVTRKVVFSEDLVRKLHAIVERGPRAGSSPYRGGQNVIRDSASGAVVYLPPQARDVPGLMAGLARWVRRAEGDRVPVPVIAALVHYQFVTVHPYYDGNGRTARLLATFILQKGGYGLNGFFSMEEHHARDLAGYYAALEVHQRHNYYDGRAGADLTPWVGYFTGLLAEVFARVRDETVKMAKKGVRAEPELLRRMEHRARTVLSMFVRQDRITTNDAAGVLGLSSRMARLLLKKWAGDGWLVPTDTSNRGRAYRLSAKYRQFIGNPPAKAP